MGVKEVYEALEDIFPQIDPRLLRAVSLDHSQDVEAAINAVLEEIIPFFTERSSQSCQSSENKNFAGSKAHTDFIPTPGIGGVQQSLHDANDEHDDPLSDTHSGNQEGDGRKPCLKSSEHCEKSSSRISTDEFSHIEPVTVIDRTGENSNHIEILNLIEIEETVSTGKHPESSTETVSNQSPTFKDMNHVPTCEEFDVPLGSESNVAIHEENHQGKFCASGKSLEMDSFVEQPSVQDITMSTSSSAQSEIVPELQETHVEKLDACFLTDATSKIESTDEMVGVEDGSTLSASVSQSGQICVIDLVEDAIADARNNKKTLFSAMESVISMMKEVELKEKTAAQTKKEAAKGGADMLDKVEELRQMILCAKEANDMHAGEVYGEKAILSTEVKELQSRVRTLSDERDKSLATLDKMRQTLEMRLAAAENMIKSAEQERVEKENSARKLLSEQELEMEKVVQESKKLKQQAEENAKLREFLVDRGRVVDTLQGEMAVIRQDVRLLKEKLDERVPFSKSLSSSQTSFIMASSSTSSLKTLVPDQLERLEKRDPEPCPDEQVSEKEVSNDDTKERIDEEWEIFENL